ncbi:MAG: regulatory protein RecX [Eubacterium sp.]|nr:regulatory protein RecX [Eubacterium sp.]
MKISHKNGKGNKIHLYIDGEYQITTNADFYAENYFSENSEISEEEWQDLLERINYSKAVNKCFDLLSRRSHSVKELRDKLLKFFDSQTADKAVNQMIEYGYLNDEEYAKELFDYLLNTKKLSKRFIVLEMNKRGISSEIYDNLLASADIDNVGTAFDIITSKYLNKLSAEGGRQKVISAMVRKGFSYSDVCAALERLDYEDF